MNKYTKMAIILPLIAYSAAANAEITLDSGNVSFAGAKESTLTINADGTVMVSGVEVAKCAGGESAKVTKAKTATITCDADYVKVRDKKGNELTRYSSYVKASANGVEERKLFNESWARIGSATTGAAVYSETKEVVEQKKEEVTTTTTIAPAPGFLDAQKPKPAAVNEKIYTPKLGTTAQETPSVTKKNTIADAKADKEVKKAEKAAKELTANPPKPVLEETTVITTTPSQEATKITNTTTNIIQPTPDAAASGVMPETKTETVTESVPVEGGVKEELVTPTPTSN